MTNHPRVPEHEPEIVDAIRGDGDFEKVPTTSLQGIVVDGCTITSRYRKAHELNAMIEMVKAVATGLRPRLLRIDCDSKSTTYSVTLTACDHTMMLAIGAQLERGLLSRLKGHSGIYLTSENGLHHEVEPDYETPDDDDE